MWKEYETARRATDEIIRRMGIACYIRVTNATDTHSEYVILLALPQ